MADQVPATVDLNSAADKISSLLDNEHNDETTENASDSQQTEEPEEGSEEEGADEDAQEQTEQTPTATYTVRIDGKDSKVSLDELIHGYQRSADYTAKTQALAQQRREQQAEFDAVRHERARYSTLLNQLEAHLSQQSAEPNWEELRQTDPIGFATKWAEHQRIQQQRAAIQQEQQRLRDQQQFDEQEQLRGRLAVEAERLVEAIPAWKDPAKAAVERKSLVEYGLKAGFSSEELNSVYDHRAVQILYKAMKYDQALARRAEAQAKGNAPPPVARMLPPGQGNAARGLRSGAVTKAKERLAKSGSVEDAAALFERIL